MKAIVIKRFKDKYTKEIHEVNKPYEASEERIQELVDLGYLAIEENEKSVLDGNVDEVKKVLNELDEETLKVLLEEEQANKNRKSVVEHIYSLLND